MIAEFDTLTITKTGRIGLLLACIKKNLDKFNEYREVKEEINSLINDGWKWLKNRDPDCSHIYHIYNPLLLQQELLFHNHKDLLKTFHAVLYMHHYTIQKMFVIEYFENDKREPSVGSDINEVDETYFFNCINYTIETSIEPQIMENWISDKIDALKIDYKPQNKDDAGKTISEDYFFNI